ncbi:hypothetical protein Tco_0966847 [Tanacetum coccineum]
MNFMPPNTDLSFSGLEEFVNERIVSVPTVKKHVVETSKAKTTKAKPKVIRKNNGAPIIEDWVSDSEEENVPQLRFKRKMETQDMPVRPMLVGFGNQRTKVIDHVSKHNNASTILKRPAWIGKTPSRSFRPVKSAEILWLFWVSSSFGVSLTHDGSWSKWDALNSSVYVVIP